MEFRILINSSLAESQSHSREARFSFLQGGYVEDFYTEGTDFSLLVLMLLMRLILKSLCLFYNGERCFKAIPCMFILQKQLALLSKFNIITPHMRIVA